MIRYRCTFHGRERGAIGISSDYVVDLDAESPEAARLKLYDTHEHISGLKVTDPEGKVFRP